MVTLELADATLLSSIGKGLEVVQSPPMAFHENGWVGCRAAARG
jgi:hypothetical protein